MQVLEAVVCMKSGERRGEVMAIFPLPRTCYIVALSRKGHGGHDTVATIERPKNVPTW